MSGEADFIAALRGIVRTPGARDLMDDVAVIPPPVGRDLVITHDMIAEGVHFLATDPPSDVAWKLLAVNLSDLAAKGAKPVGVILGYTLSDPEWDRAFVEGMGRALDHFGVPLLGGDTISAPHRCFGLTALGEAPPPVPDRRGARAGDRLWVCGTIGDAGLGLRIAKGEIEGPRRLLKAYRLPKPLLAQGRSLAPRVSAMADVSDGLLIDASRMAAASGLHVRILLDAMPLSPEAQGFGTDCVALLAAATAGDDYALLCAAAPDRDLSDVAVPVGEFSEGAGLSLLHEGRPVPLPQSLGWMHRN